MNRLSKQQQRLADEAVSRVVTDFCCRALDGGMATDAEAMQKAASNFAKLAAAALLAGYGALNDGATTEVSISNLGLTPADIEDFRRIAANYYKAAKP